MEERARTYLIVLVPSQVILPLCSLGDKLSLRVSAGDHAPKTGLVAVIVAKGSSVVFKALLKSAGQNFLLKDPLTGALSHP